MAIESQAPAVALDDRTPQRRGLAGWKGYKWLVVFMLWFICFFNYADRQAVAAVAPKIREEFKLNEFQMGLILSAFAWVYAAGAPFAGFIADRMRRKTLILGGCLFWSFVTMLTGFCHKFWQFLGVLSLEGLGETFYFPSTMSLVSDYHSRRTRSRAMSIHQSSVYAGTIAGTWFAAWVAEKYGWRLGFYVFGALGMLLAVVLYMFLIEPRRGQADEAEGVPAIAEKPLSLSQTAVALFRKPTVLLLMLGFMMANFVATVFLGWTPTFLVDKFDFKLSAAGLSGSVFIHAASALSVPIAGYFADRAARRLPGGRILVQAGGLLVGATFVFLVGYTKDYLTLIMAMSVFGLCKGVYDSSIFASMYDMIEPRARASAAGLMNTVGWAAGALGPVTFGWLALHGSHKVLGVATTMGVEGSEKSDKLAKVANMSESIQWLGAVYVVAAVTLLVAALVFAKRDVIYKAAPAKSE